jgi:hypothetical protein
MLPRVGGFLGSLLIAAFMLVGGLAVLAGGYWLSDRAYDAGLWPIGAIMRVALLLMLLGFAVSVLFHLVAAVATLFRDSEDV